MTQTPREDARLRELLNMGREAWRRLQDPAVPRRLKAIPFLALLYFLSPVDLIPDSVPVLTQLDDLAIAIVALRLFLNLTGKLDTEAGQASEGNTTVETTYRVRDE